MTKQKPTEKKEPCRKCAAARERMKRFFGIKGKGTKK
jgi:hypothetical protein